MTSHISHHNQDYLLEYMQDTNPTDLKIGQRKAVYYDFLENGYPCNITLPAEDNRPARRYNSVETAFLAWKTTDDTVRKILETMTADEALDYFAAHRPDLREDFNHISKIYEIQKFLIIQKFSSNNIPLVAMLLETKQEMLMTNGSGTDYEAFLMGHDKRRQKGYRLTGVIAEEIRSTYQAFDLLAA